MIWLQLKKEGQLHTIDLAPETSIPGEISCDLLALDFEQAERTFPFDIPATPANVRFFGAPGAFTSTADLFQEYDGVIGFGANVFKTGYFRLTEASSNYKGFLKAKQSVWAAIKDQAIGEVIGEEMIKMYLHSEMLDRHDQRAEVVFPSVLMPAFYNTRQRTQLDWLGLNPLRSTPNATLFDVAGFFNYYFADYRKYRGVNILPVPRLLVVLEALLRSQGYEVQYNFDIEHLYKIILFAHVAADNPFKVYASLDDADREDIFQYIMYAQALPKITVADFFRSLRIAFGVKFTWHDNGKCEVDLLKDIIKSKKHVDITRFLSPKPVREQDRNTYTFSFPDTDKRQGKDDLQELIQEMDEQDPVLFFSQLPDPTSSDQGVCRLVLTENQYYTPKLVGTKWSWVPLNKRLHSGLSGETKLEAKITPAEMATEVVLEFRTVAKSTNNGANTLGWTVAPFFDDPGFIDPVNDRVQIVEPAEYASDYSEFTYNGIDEAVLKPTKDGERITSPSSPVTLTCRLKKKLPFMVPIIREQGSSNFFDNHNPEFKPVMAFYHGLTPRANGKGQTALASSSNYDSAGNRQAPFALRFTGDDGLVAHFWEDVLLLLSKTEKVKANALLPIDFVRNFDARLKLRVKGATFHASQIRYVLTNTGIRIAAMELRQLRYNADSISNLADGILWADDDNALFIDEDGAYILAE